MNSNSIPTFMSPSSSNAVKEQAPVSFKTLLANALLDQKPGDIITGTIADRNKDSLTILLSDETVLHAVLDASVSLNIGDSASFQISGYEGSSLMLKLLSSSVSSTLNATVEKALSEANMPQNEQTKELVQSLLNENLPIDKDTLKLLYQQMRTYPDTPVKDLILLMKLNLPATPASITQLGLYQNQEHQITKQFEDLKNTLVDYMANTSQSSDTHELLDALGRILDSKGSQGITELSALLSDTLSSSLDSASNAISVSDSVFTSDLTVSAEQPDNSLNAAGNTMHSDDTVLESVSSDAAALKQTLSTSMLFSDTEFLKLFSKTWKNHFSLTPEDLKKDGISSFYDRLNEDLQVLKDVLAQKSGSQSETAAKQVSNLSDNLEFMRNVNSAMLFAQIPFQLKDKNIHSELFVYTKKKELKKNPDDISVLLHLDMDSLGPVDVHISMHLKNVQAKFYLTEDSCSLVETHLPAFSKHLQSKGYYLNYSIEEQKKIHSVMDEIKKSCDNPVVIKGSRYAFDQRA